MTEEQTVTKVTKRDGRVVAFDPKRIEVAISKAVKESHEFNEVETTRLAQIVVNIMIKAKNHHIPSVEEIQDVVEQVLMAGGHYQTAKRYILYREERRKERSARSVFGVEDDLGMGINAFKAMARRYLTRNERGEVVETPKQAMERVVKAVVSVEKKDRQKWQKKFLEMMTTFAFVPAGCYFRGAGRKKGLLANCFVLPIEDDMEAIFDAVKWTALIHQAGGGSGFNFSHLRPKGDVVGGGGFASGPISFMKAFDAATGIVMLGGRHRGANMGILNVDHPDIFEFITCKTQEGEIANFNISLGASDKFMTAVQNNKPWQLKNPRTGAIIQTVQARTIFDQAVALAWRTGDPGMIYLTEVNQHNPLLKALGPIEATNVCGEQPLHPFDVCNLGSINLAKFVKKVGKQTEAYEVDWEKLEKTVRLAVRFLDDGIDASEYPIKQIAEMAHKVRRIGLGVMGWADMLIRLKVKYDSEAGVKLAQKIMGFIQRVGWEESANLAQEKGEFPLWEKSDYAKTHPVLGKRVKVRNIAVTTIAPTGTISMMAECNSGIEPFFALSYIKNVVEEQGLAYTNAEFDAALANLDIANDDKQEILTEIAKRGSLKGVKGLPMWLTEVFRTAHEISPEWHVKVQAAFQKYTDNAVSKTINFPETATIDEVRNAYLLAWQSGCKGVTIYRDKSKSVQVLKMEGGERDIKIQIQSKMSVEPLALRSEKEVSPEVTKMGTCPECGGNLYFSEGCVSCPACGWSACSA